MRFVSELTAPARTVLTAFITMPRFDLVEGLTNSFGPVYSEAQADETVELLSDKPSLGVLLLRELMPNTPDNNGPGEEGNDVGEMGEE